MDQIPDQSKARRKHYPPDVYARLTIELTNLLDETPHLFVDRDNWDIEGEWNDAGTIHFIDASYMDRFAQYVPFDCRTIKLINYGEPAVRITFYQKHRYWLVKDADIPIEEKKLHLTDYINSLIVKTEMLNDKARLSQGEKRSNLLSVIALMHEQINTWKPVLENIDMYEVALSNYGRMHFYTQINYKYWVSHEDATLANRQEHLLNPQRDRNGNINEMRHNVVFIDSVDIQRQHAYQNKEIDKYLARFDMITDHGRSQIFARIRPGEYVPAPHSL
ncbi:hypothetical protein CLV58_14118 [Spirosoma oryzae]|uniref:Uncharacterized protein n=1 Tax=Spirosoma oryzae TaxID=1469603 RepID=A0A2T0RQU7_9BACT|nr:hypothetical protein [Spirosoma oryzae]PRY23497.1 hypothetical protein CLV58_14118 [Spirosoma oryzae]